MRRTLGALSLALAALVAGTTTTFASALVKVSDPSPFAACTVGGGPNAVNFPSAEVEPFIATDPRSSDHLVGAWQQDRWNDGGAHGLVATVTFDGGRHFRQSALPFSECTPGGIPYERASDPGVAVDRTGIVYAIGLPFDESTLRNGVAATRSLDGGRTWVDARQISAVVGQAPNGNPFDDKELVFADPTRPRTAYAVWDRFVDVPGTPGTVVREPSRPRPQAARASRAAAPAATVAQSSPAMLSVTHDGGLHWSAPRAIVPAAANVFTGSNYVVVDRRRGTVYDFMDIFTPDNVDHLAFVRSDDGGETWTAPRFFAEDQSVGANDPVTGEHVRAGGVPIPAIDPNTGRLYDVWEDGRLSGGTFSQVLIATSGDGGLTWSAPALVSTPTGRPAFEPTISVAADGTVGVLYYDYRFLAAGNTTSLPTDTWLKKAEPGGELEFGRDIHVSGSFDMLVAPFVDTRGHFVGDYQGLSAAEGRFHPLFVRAGASAVSNRTDVFTGTF
jgi:hypothetical protein